jgi:hypothetical protein
LGVGAELAIYPAEVKTRGDLPAEPLATAEVTAVSATRAHAKILDQRQEIRPPARAVITQQVYGGIRRKVAFQADQTKAGRAAIKVLAEAVATALAGGTPSLYLEVVKGAGQGADLHVVADGCRLTICGPDGTPLVQPEEIAKHHAQAVAGTLRALETIARFHILQGQSNQERNSQLQGKVKLRLRRYVEGGDPKPLPKEARSEGGELTLIYEPDHDDRNLYVVDVINESPREIYPHVFLLNPDYSIVRLYPNYGQQWALAPQGVLTVGKEGWEPPLDIFLSPSKEEPDEPRWEWSRDQLLVIATVEPVPDGFEGLRQEKLDVPPPTRGKQRAAAPPIAQLLEAVAQGKPTRAGRQRTPGGLAKEDWGTRRWPSSVG